MIGRSIQEREVLCGGQGISIFYVQKKNCSLVNVKLGFKDYKGRIRSVPWNITQPFTNSPMMQPTDQISTESKSDMIKL